MSKYRNHHYRKETYGKSLFDNNPTLIINRYHPPNTYTAAVKDAITAYRNGFSFNKAVDQAAAVYPNLNRNKLAEHTLKTIANDY